MVQAIDFAVRNSAGAVTHGIAGGEGSNFIQIGSGEQISLNVAQSSVLGYERKGANLIVHLVDGSDVVLNGYYDVAPGQLNRLYLSSNGEVTEVLLGDAGTAGPVAASYGPVDAWNKFSTLDDLRFEGADAFADAQIYSDEPAGMGALAPGLLGAGGLGAAALAAGLLGGVALLGGGSSGEGGDSTDNSGGDGTDDGDDDGTDDGDDDGTDDGDDDGTDDGDDDGTDDGDDDGTDDGDDDGTDDGDDDGTDRAEPTVDDPDHSETLTTNTEDPKLVITGTGEPGDHVTVVVGDRTQTTTITSNGTWGVEFSGENFPSDGNFSSEVTVTGGGFTYELDGPDFIIDMTPPPVSATRGVESVGDVENAAEYADGVTIAGRGEAGATVEVVIGGVSHTTTVGPRGNWSVTFTTSEIPSGEAVHEATITATDPLGNQTVITENVVIDTEIPLAITSPAMGDDYISAAERSASAGITLSGTGEAGASIEVSVEGVTRSATVADDGSWSVNFAGTELRAGTYDSTVSVTSTDAAGNSTTETHVVHIDTEVRNFAGATDSVVNAADAAGDLEVTGTVEVGARVQVEWKGTWYNASVDASGNWSASIPASAIPAGESNVVLTMRATDHIGNVSTQTQTVRVDTLVNTLGLSGEIGGDGVINAAEHAQGVTVSGFVEPNSTVEISLPNGATRTVTAGANGRWSADFASADLPSGDGVETTFTVTATDSVGNTDFFEEAVTIDTVAPPSPEITAVTPTKDGSGNAVGVRALYTEMTDDTYTFDRVDASGSVTHISATETDNQTFGETEFRFGSNVPDGSYLVINNADAAGNSSSTLLIVNTTSSVEVDLDRAGLSHFDFAAVDLTWAPDAQLTITDTQLHHLTGSDHTLIIKGDSRDDVTLDGDFHATGTRTMDGQSYTIYTLDGGAGSVLVDDDITTRTI